MITRSRTIRAKLHDVNVLDEIAIEPGSIYIMDRGYFDFHRLHRIYEGQGFFVTRLKKNTQFYVRESRPVDRSTGLKCDQIIRPNGSKTKTQYPDKLRRVRYVDPETNHSLAFLTNHFNLPPLIIAALYNRRWSHRALLQMARELEFHDFSRTLAGSTLSR